MQKTLPEVCVREHSIVVHQQRRALKLRESRAREPRRPVLAKVETQPNLSGTSVVGILHEFFQDRCPFGVISEYLSDSHGEVDLLTEVLTCVALTRESGGGHGGGRGRGGIVLVIIHAVFRVRR